MPFSPSMKQMLEVAATTPSSPLVAGVVVDMDTISEKTLIMSAGLNRTALGRRDSATYLYKSLRGVGQTAERNIRPFHHRGTETRRRAEPFLAQAQNRSFWFSPCLCASVVKRLP